MIEFDLWYKKNMNEVEELYYDFLSICYNNNITIIDDQVTKNKFILMIYSMC